MDTQQSVKERRSVKHYVPSFELPQEHLDQLIDCTLLSPTSFNIQNWRFVVIKDKQVREKIREVAWNQALVTDASVLFVLCADLKSWEKDPQRYWVNAPKETQDFLVPAIIDYYKDNNQLWRDEAMRSCGIAAQTLMLMAKSLGYDSCPMIGFDQDKVAELIKLPDDHVVCMMLVVGKGTKPAWPKPGQLPPEDVLIKNHF